MPYHRSDHGRLAGPVRIRASVGAGWRAVLLPGRVAALVGILLILVGVAPVAVLALVGVLLVLVGVAPVAVLALVGVLLVLVGVAPVAVLALVGVLLVLVGVAPVAVLALVGVLLVLVGFALVAVLALVGVLLVLVGVVPVAVLALVGVLLVLVGVVPVAVLALVGVLLIVRVRAVLIVALRGADVGRIEAAVSAVAVARSVADRIVVPVARSVARVPLLVPAAALHVAHVVDVAAPLVRHFGRIIRVVGDVVSLRLAAGHGSFAAGIELRSVGARPVCRGGRAGGRIEAGGFESSGVGGCHCGSCVKDGTTISEALFC